VDVENGALKRELPGITDGAIGIEQGALQFRMRDDKTTGFGAIGLGRRRRKTLAENIRP
jgi:hypothetical protein